jgi:hypothetical protein
MGRAYGGHVYAQAAWAAAQTVPEGFVLHVSYSCDPIPYVTRSLAIKTGVMLEEQCTGD